MALPNSKEINYPQYHHLHINYFIKLFIFSSIPHRILGLIVHLKHLAYESLFE